MSNEQEKAVALAEKHGAAKVVGFISDQIHMQVDYFVALLAERDQQHTEELANKTGLVPGVFWHDGVYYCVPRQVREALATMQAKYEQLYNLWFELLGTTHKLEQERARVAELEKDAARWEWAVTHPNRFEDFYEEAFHAIPSSVGFVENVKTLVTKNIDAAMRGQQP